MVQQLVKPIKHSVAHVGTANETHNVECNTGEVRVKHGEAGDMSVYVSAKHPCQIKIVYLSDNRVAMHLVVSQEPD